MKRGKIILRVVGSIILLGFVLQRVNLSNVLTAIGSASEPWLILTLGLVFLRPLLGSVRWHCLLTAQERTVPVRDLYAGYLVGSFVNLFLPTSLGGDFVRAIRISPMVGDKVQSLSVVGFERIVGSFAQVITAMLALAFVASQLDAPRTLWIVLVLLAVFIVGFGFLFVAPSMLEAFRRRLPSWFRLRERFHRVVSSSAMFRVNWKWPLFSVLLSFLVQLNIVLFHIAVLKAVGIAISPIYMFIYVPVVLILQMLPVSIHGIGISENAYLFFFAHHGVSTDLTVAFSWLILLMAGLSTSVAGGIILLFHRSSPRNMAKETTESVSS